jgi:hypothetical protein
LLVILSKLLLRAKDLGEPRDVARNLYQEKPRHNDRAFGSHPCQTAPLPVLIIARPTGSFVFARCICET